MTGRTHPPTHPWLRRTEAVNPGCRLIAQDALGSREYGSVANQPATGAVASSASLSATTGASIVVSIGGIGAPVAFSGLAPGFFGLYQINVQVPLTSPTGSAVPLTISMGGAGSNQATVAIVARGS